MPQLVIAAAGAAIGHVAFGAVAFSVGSYAVSGAALGWTVGSLIGSQFGPTQKSQGPRLGDLSVSSSAYGTPIPYTQGSPRLAGQIIWASAKREVATTTRSGKGGRKQKVTTYTYEVDLLYLLTDNEIEGVSRIWSNGKLVWNKTQGSSAATRAASDAATDWTSLAVYTGASTQGVDPIYEAAVGTANAPAYRGRGTVMIEGLQLGSSGAIPNLTFEIGQEWEGDHPANDGLTIFQTAFAAAVSDDISVSALGAGVELGAGTKVDGYYTADFDAVTTVNRGIIWYADADLSLGAGAPLTCEMFFTCIEVATDPACTGKIFQLQFGTVTLDVYMRPHTGAYNPILLDAGTLEYTTTSEIFGTMHHLAMVFRTTNLCDVYLDGVRVITGESFSSAATGQIQMGGSNGTYANRWTMRYHGGRVRRAEMYSGASFTPPTSTADWGNP